MAKFTWTFFLPIVMLSSSLTKDTAERLDKKDYPPDKYLEIAPYDLTLNRENAASEISFESEINSQENDSILGNIDSTLLENRQSLKVNWVPIKKQSANGSCHLEAYHPKIQGLVNSGIEQKINYQLESISREAVLSSDSMLLGKSKSSYNLCIKQKTRLPKIGIQMYGCTIAFAQKELISFYCYESHTPGAYPAIYIRSITINLAMGEPLIFSNLFNSKANFQHIIADMLVRDYLPPNASENSFSSRLRNISSSQSFYLSEQCEFHKGMYAKWKLKHNEYCIVLTNMFGTSGPFKGRRFAIPLPQVEEQLNPEFLRAIRNVK
jgi:hypothetical protein